MYELGHTLDVAYEVQIGQTQSKVDFCLSVGGQSVLLEAKAPGVFDLAEDLLQSRDSLDLNSLDLRPSTGEKVMNKVNHYPIISRMASLTVQEGVFVHGVAQL